MSSNPDEREPYLVSAFIILYGVSTCILCAISIYRGIQDSNLLYTTEFITYLVLMIYKLLIFSSIKLNVPRFHSFARELRKDFRYVCKEGSKYRKRYFENQLFIWKASLLAAIYAFIIGFGMILFSIMELAIYLYTHEPGNRGHRPLPLQFWFFDIDFGVTPVYEIMFILGCQFIMSHIFVILFSLPTSVIWVIQITSKADIVIWNIQDLLGDIKPNDILEERRLSSTLKERMRDIIIKHQSMYKLLDDYSAIYKIILMYEQKLGPPLVCLTAYCTAETLDHGNLDANSLFIFFSLVVISYIPSYLCTFLSDKIISVCDACWDIPLWKAGRLVKVLRPYLVLIMQKSLRPLVLQTPGFKDVSVQTYADNMAVAYSWFNMLRQSHR